MDLHRKKISSASGTLVLESLFNTYTCQDSSEGIIFHIDLGSQYTSNDMKKLCEKLKMKQSFSKKWCPYDNTCIESFHATLKKE